MEQWRVYIVLWLVINISRAMGLYRHTYSACYGITTDNFIKASCPGDEKIVMDAVYAYAKPLSAGCPETMTNSATTPESCCQHENGDCGFEYDGFNKNTYYENCHGMSACYWTPVAWANAPCNGSVYPLRTNYMEVSFYCISENEVKDVSEDGSVNTTTAILLNPGYVSGNNTGSLPASSTFKCSISASCATTLQIRTLSLNFTKEGGICGQSLTISDGTNTQVLSCDSNTNFLPADLHVANNTYYLEIQVNNTLSRDAGYFLLQIGDGNSDDPMTVSCGASVGEGRVVAEDLPVCSNKTVSDDSSTIKTTVSGPTTDSSGTIPSQDDSNRTMGLYRHTYSACYGITTDNFIKASCPGDEKIVMDAVYAYAKPLSAGCPDTMTNSATTPESCCQHEDGDCGFEYDGFNKSTYYENCQGMSACYWTPVAWANASCNVSVFPPRTNYMEVSFFCISENEVKDVSEDGSVNTTTAIFVNPGYVSGNNTGSLPANSTFKCSISVPCATTLQIRTLSLNFTKEGGICGQSLTISDGSNTQVLSCDSNTDFLPADLHVANNTRYLEIQVNNTLSRDAGYFLLQIGDGGDDDPMTLACGASVGEGRVAAEECSNKTVSKTTGNSTDSSGTMPSTSPEDAGNNLGIIIGVIVGVLLLAFVGALVFFRNKIKDFYIKKCQNEIEPEKNPSELEVETSDESYLFAPFGETVLPQVAPMSALMHTPLPPVHAKHKLPPISKTSLIKENEIEAETHKDKKVDNEKRKKKKHKKNKKKKKHFDDVTKIDDLESSIKPAFTTVDVTEVS